MRQGTGEAAKQETAERAGGTGHRPPPSPPPGAPRADEDAAQPAQESPRPDEENADSDLTPVDQHDSGPDENTPPPAPNPPPPDHDSAQNSPRTDQTTPYADHDSSDADHDTPDADLDSAPTGQDTTGADPDSSRAGEKTSAGGRKAAPVVPDAEDTQVIPVLPGDDLVQALSSPSEGGAAEVAAEVAPAVQPPAAPDVPIRRHRTPKSSPEESAPPAHPDQDSPGDARQPEDSTGDDPAAEKSSPKESVPGGSAQGPSPKGDGPDEGDGRDEAEYTGDETADFRSPAATGAAAAPGPLVMPLYLDPANTAPRRYVREILATREPIEPPAKTADRATDAQESAHVPTEATGPAAGKRVSPARTWTEKAARKRREREARARKSAREAALAAETARADETSRAHNATGADRTAGASKTAEAAGTARAGKTARANRMSRANKTFEADGTARAQKAARTEKAARRDQAAHPDQATRGEESARRDQAARDRSARVREGVLAGRVAGKAAFWLPPLLTIEGLVMYVLAMRVPHGPMRGVDLDKIDGLGLISVLPVTAFAAIALLIVSFFVTLTQNTDRKGLLLSQLGAITFALHGAAALIEPEPRFHTAWVHAGFAEYIGRAGEALPGLDARFAWPGFFALFGFVLRAAGIDDPSMVLQWTPFLSNLLYLLPFVLILRQIVATTRARWFAALLFVLVQWIGQDYFSPQGFTFALYLVFVAILMRWFGRAEPRTAPLPAKGRLRRLLARLDRLAPGELPARPTTVTDRVVLLTLLVGLFVATTATHQITPFMMLGALTGLILLRRSTLSLALPVFLGLIVIAWINYQATPFWSGRINELFGGIGKIFANLQENTGDRLEGTDPQHAIVLQVRLAICGVILMFAGVGLLRRLRRGVADRSALVLLCVPVLALGLQSYGGEIGLRVYMFALPAACILGAYAFFPNLPANTGDAREGEAVPERRRRFRPSPATTRKISAVLAAGTALVLSVAFLVARYGNEKFERVTTGEAAAMHYVYAHDRPSARLLYLVPVLGEEVTPTIPWRERDIDLVEYDQALVTKNPKDLAGVLTALRGKAANTFLITSRGQAAYLELNHGFPSDWGKRFRAALDSSTSLKRVFANADAAIYTLRSYPKGSEIPPPTAMTLVGDRSTPWTPVGLVALALAVATLFAAELVRLRGTERTPRGRRRLVIVGMLMTAAALAVIVERFLTLTSP
ncbi:hypothetical protein [Sphaerisporangium siamense]|uniref:Uncharacterized protein n=1 Tax=Sphaerisporangium siamense TaxID=795645 RepID=A0A7W7G8F0_9ACTN|nr:hypothetical protein [Sphaerisporangium siamense]MBB4701708.1 hypothetical protein [Sphaerisporangium siamense]